MHPGFHAWWRGRGRSQCGAEAFHAHGGGPDFRGPFGHYPGGHDGPHHPGHHGPHHPGHHGPHRPGEGAFAAPHFEHDPGSLFGVRRPLRFLAHKLDLSEAQVGVFAGILDELKTERAQASVDERRRISALADAVEGASYDEHKAGSAGDEQVKSAERLKNAVDRALRRMHAALDDEQRKRLAYLLRTGMLSV
jgi:hypothetical protein